MKMRKSYLWDSSFNWCACVTSGTFPGPAYLSYDYGSIHSLLLTGWGMFWLRDYPTWPPTTLPYMPPGLWTTSSRTSGCLFGPLSPLTVGKQIGASDAGLPWMEKFFSQFSEVFPQLLFILNNRQPSCLASALSQSPPPIPQLIVNKN